MVHNYIFIIFKISIIFTVQFKSSILRNVFVYYFSDSTIKVRAISRPIPSEHFQPSITIPNIKIDSSTCRIQNSYQIPFIQLPFFKLEHS